MLAAAIAIAVVVMVGFWIAGGVILRFGGLIVAIFGVLVLAVDHSLAGICWCPAMARRALALRAAPPRV